MDPERKSPVNHQSPSQQVFPSQSKRECRAYERTLSVLSALAETSTLALGEITARVANAARRGLDFEHLNLLLMDEEQNSLMPLEHNPEVKLSVGQGLWGWVAQHGAPLNVADVSQDPRHVVVPSLWPPDVRSALIAPLMVGDRLIGVIDVASSRPHAFDADDQRLVTIIGQQLAVTIDNARLYQETERRLREVSTLYQLAQQMNTSLDVQEMLDSIVHSLKRTMGCRGCSIALLDAVDNALEICASAGIDSKWHRDFKLQLGEGIAGRVALEGTPVYVADALQLDDFIFFDPTVRSLLTVPLSIKQRVIGTLTVDSDQPNAFSAADERLLTIAATQVAIAIENARLYASLEQRAQNLAQAYAELKIADRLKDELVQNVSHELRTPLTFLKGYVELLLEEEAGPLNAEQKKYLEILSEKTDTLTQLVNNIMSLQYAEQVLEQKGPISLTQLARRAVRGCMATARKNNINLVEDLPPDLPPVSGDEGKLLQVFNNLLGNAIKFSPDGGEITVTLEDAGPMVQVSVSDQGIGIPKDKQGHIFEKFYQVDGSIRRRFGGAGLGLAIVKHIVEAHQGQVWVESDLGQGSTFYFTLPKYQKREKSG